MKKICLKCGKEFSKKITCSKKEWKTTKFCSHGCANSVNANKERLSNYIKENGVWNKGKSMPKGKNNSQWKRVEKVCLKCGKKFIVKNYRKNSAKFCSHNCEHKNRDKGLSTESEKIRKSIEFRLWREAIFARDNWTCQKTKIKGGKLHPHHIQNFAQYPELRFAIDNGITSSEKAHKEFHEKYGNHNNTREQINEFLCSTN